MVQGELNFSRIYIHSKPLSYQQQFQRVLLQIQNYSTKIFKKTVKTILERWPIYILGK